MKEYKGWKRHFLIFPKKMWNETFWLEYVYRRYHYYDGFWIPRGFYIYRPTFLDVLKSEGDV